RHACASSARPSPGPNECAQPTRTEATSVLLNSAIRTKRPQPLIRPDPIRMPVRPVRLQGVVADRLYRVESERRGRVALGEAAGHAAEEVGLAGAGGAGAGAAELFERIV